MTYMGRCLLLTLGTCGLLVGCDAYMAECKIDVHRLIPDPGDDEAVALDKVKHVRIETVNGRVEVRGEEGRKGLEFHAVKRARGTTLADARSWAERITIDVGPDPGDPSVLCIVAKRPLGSSGRSCGVSFEVSVDPALALDVKSSNGRITVFDADADVRAVTSNGSVVVDRADGRVHAESGNSDITCLQVRGPLVAKTSNGKITLKDVRQGPIKAETSNGKIKADDVSGQIKLTTSNGAITLAVRDEPLAPQIDVKTSNGPVDVKLPAAAKARLKARTSNGRIETHFDGAKVGDLETDRNSMSAVLNDGGGTVDLTTSNGRISLETRGAQGG